KIIMRRHLDAPRPAAEKNGVQIKGQDLPFGECALNTGGNNDLADLAFVGDVIAYQQVFDHLLGVRGPALRAAWLGQVRDKGPDHTAFVDASVLEEALVLRGNKG